MNKACFFDLDGTLIPNPSSESRLLVTLFKKFCFSPSGLVIWFLESLFRYRNFKNSKAYYQGIKLRPLQIVIQRKLKSFENFLSKKALEYLQEKRKEEFQLFLITGTPHFIAEAINSILNFNGVFSSNLEVRHGKLTGRIISTIPYGKNKAKIVRKLAEEQNIDLKESISFGDSYNDLHFLKMTGTCYAVNPDARLKRFIPPENILTWD